jgi:hypothetical protein
MWYVLLATAYDLPVLASKKKLAIAILVKSNFA